MKTRKMRVFPAWSFQQEENWLNDMAQQGWFLEAVSPFVYDFTAVEPGSYQIRLQLLTEAKESEKSRDYLQFVEDIGAQQIAAFGRWVYFKKKTDGKEFQLFSDIASRKKHLRTVQILILPILLIMSLNFSNMSLLRENSPVRIVIWIFSLLMGALLIYGLVRLELKIREMEKEKDYTE
ncbi:MAG: DUF2812 domain-containing protein [Peptoniphilaceae bacterium]|jgi:hypothetical protein